MTGDDRVGRDPVRGVNHRDHLGLIRSGVLDAGPRWLELGSGEGAFTLALAELLAPSGSVVALDRDQRALRAAMDRIHAQGSGSIVSSEVGDFTHHLPEGPFDGVLAANSLHFVRDRRSILASIRAALRPAGRLVVVEYDTDEGNPWVPYPFSAARWQVEAETAGFVHVQRIHRVASSFLGAIYGAVAERPRSSPPTPEPG